MSTEPLRAAATELDAAALAKAYPAYLEASGFDYQEGVRHAIRTYLAASAPAVLPGEPSEAAVRAVANALWGKFANEHAPFTLLRLGLFDAYAAERAVVPHEEPPSGYCTGCGKPMSASEGVP